MTILIKEDITLSSDTTYTDNLQVAAGVTITVNSGVTLDLGGRELLNYGTINLIGAENNLATIKNGKYSNQNTSGIFNSNLGKIESLTIDSFFNDGSLNFESTVILNSSVDAYENTNINNSLFQNSPFDVSGTADSVVVTKTTFKDSQVEIGAWTGPFQGSATFTQSNFINDTRSIYLNPFFSGNGMYHKINLIDSYIFAPTGSTFEDMVFDADDDLRVATDITSSGLQEEPYTNIENGFKVGNYFLSLSDLGQADNTAPTGITLDSTTVAENAVASHIANISGVDPDSDDLTYSVTGGTDASSFAIVNNMLHLATGVSADYETQSSYSVTLTATDLEGLTYNEDFTISITDVEETSTLYGTPGDNILDGFSGYDIIDGGDGLDTVKYSVSSDDVLFSVNDAGQLVIEDSFKHSETLVDIERLQFTEKVYALDLDGNAGDAAKAIVASFGADSLNAYMSAALSIVDSGTSLESLCDLVVDLKLIDQLAGSSSNSSFVGHLFKNVVGRSPNLFENALYTNQLDNGTYTKSSLLALAANTTLTEVLVTANSVDLIGVPGSADGEILALQYDLGLG